MVIANEGKTAMSEWNEDLPIYRQLREKVVGAILGGALKEGDPLPSVRTVAMDLEINPLTVSKAYSGLVEEGLVEKRAGLGLFVIEGGRDRLLAAERRKFMEEEWPRVRERIRSIGLTLEQLAAPEIREGENP